REEATAAHPEAGNAEGVRGKSEPAARQDLATWNRQPEPRRKADSRRDVEEVEGSVDGLIPGSRWCIVRGCPGQSCWKPSKIRTRTVTTRSTWTARSSLHFVRSVESRRTHRSSSC